MRFPSNEILIQHIAKNHRSITETSFRCLETECRRSFLHFDSFKKHRRKEHGADHHDDVNFVDNFNVLSNSTHNDNDSNPNGNVPSNSNCNVDDIESDYLDFVKFDQDVHSIESVDYFVDLRKNLTFLVSEIHSYPDMTRSRANDIVNNVSKLLTKQAEIFEKVIANSSDLDTLNALIATMKEPFKFLGGDTEFKRLEYFRKKTKTYIPPEQIKLGERVEYDIKNKNNQQSQPETRPLSHRKCTAEFIPLRLVLRKFFELPGVLSDTLTYLEYLNNTSVISNFVQGEFWRAKMNLECYREKLILPLFPYADEYENNNPLGAHRGISKCLAVYAGIPCLPPHYVSKLDNIFMFVLFNSIDYKIFKNKIIFERIIKELEYLHDHGVTVECDGVKKTIYFMSALWVGDNLGLNSFLGFTQCFYNTVCCRICLCPSSEFSEVFHESLCQLRTKENYVQCLVKNKVSETGIVEECVFNQLPFFHCIDSLSVCIMHDIFGGVCQYDSSLMLHYFIVIKKYFNLQLLNERLKSFSYDVYNDNRVPEITGSSISSSGSIKLYAAEMYIFYKYFGLLLGDKIPKDDQCYRLYIVLNEIIKIITCKYYNVNFPDYLEILIEEYLYLRRQLFPHSPAKFKHHNLIHYPHVMRLMGPLSGLSSIRFEAKHQQGKKTSKTTSCRVNICRTIAIKHQLILSHRFLSAVPNIILDFGPFLNTPLEAFPKNSIDFLPLEIRNCKDNIPVYKFLIFYGKKITESNIFRIINGDGDDEIFTIDLIFRYQNDTYFLTRKIYFMHCEHFQAFRVLDICSNFTFLKNFYKYVSFCVGNIHRGGDGNKYCTLNVQ